VLHLKDIFPQEYICLKANATTRSGKRLSPAFVSTISKLPLQSLYVDLFVASALVEFQRAGMPLQSLGCVFEADLLPALLQSFPLLSKLELDVEPFRLAELQQMNQLAALSFTLRRLTIQAKRCSFVPHAYHMALIGGWVPQAELSYSVNF